jgi:hypothetical protein
MTIAYMIIVALAVAAIFFGIRYFVRMRQQFGGEQVIICPETGKQAMVEVDARHAALSSLLGKTDLQLENCWRWPIKQDCGQECLLQLNLAPDECLVRSVLEKWYRDKSCVFCHRPFGEIKLVDHKPALLDERGLTIEWTEIPFARVSNAMAKFRPVCWNCHISHSFRLEHPDLVIERHVM